MAYNKDTGLFYATNGGAWTSGTEPITYKKGAAYLRRLQHQTAV